MPFLNVPLKKLGLDEVKLNSEIAKRAVLRSDRSNSRLYMQVYESAKRHLARQEYGAAATLFQFFLKQYPGDTCAQNSRGSVSFPIPLVKLEISFRMH